MQLLNVALAIFAGTALLLNLFAAPLARWSLPAPLLALLVGVLIGPGALGVMRIDDIGGHDVLEQVARLTVGVGLIGIAQRLPSGYWRRRWRWILGSIVIGMPVALLVSGALLWALLGLPLLIAVLVGAIMTPTDPIVTTPIVTGGFATSHVPRTVRLDLSSESGVNDGFGYPFVFAPILLLTEPVAKAWRDLAASTVLFEVLGAIVLGLGLGFVVSQLFRWAQRFSWMEQTSKLGFFLPFGLLVLGLLKVIGTDGILAVFVAAAVFGQRVSNAAEAEQSSLDDAVNRFFSVPAFLLLGIALPFGAWGRLGVWPAVVVFLALVVRRLAAIWVGRAVFADLHDRSQTLFMSWFGAVGVSGLYYALLAERMTGSKLVFPLVTMAIVLSVLLYGLTSAPFSRLIARRSDPSELTS
ncbi:cation:proton antiporter domain-containing protein [Amnibacterium sp.]|uniref:cation:proton antiporter domain-containing protein n=1 Tax=Amnibacterium sp. TaxID=1872496 RepID=UPI003F7BD7FD